MNFEPRTKWLNKAIPDDVHKMPQSSRILLSLAISLSMVGAFLAGAGGQTASLTNGISFEVQDQCVIVSTQNMSAALSKTFPAVAIREVDAPGVGAYGFAFSSILAYNESGDGGLVLETVPYHASLEHAIWTVDNPVVVENGDTSTVYLSMSSSVTMNKRLAAWDGNPTSGSPGIEKIENWATVTVRYVVSTSGFSSTYDGAIGDGEYPVNGSTEMKFDLSIDVNVPIDATDMALDIGLMKMEFGTFEPTAMDEQYVFRGFQSDGIVVSDPDVNETIGDDILLHTFHPRSQLKQMFAFVEDTESAFFSWASKTMSNTSSSGDELTDVTTYYRTDGEALKLYLSSELTPETASIKHDPSLGLFPSSGGYVDLPENVLGSSTVSTALGLLIGLAVAGGISAVIILRRSRTKDETEVVVLEKNRYYRGK